MNLLRTALVLVLSACSGTKESEPPPQRDTHAPDTDAQTDSADPKELTWPDPTTVASTLIQSGVIECAKPLDRIESPFEVLTEGVDWGESHEWMDNEPGIISAAGVAAGDFNADGHVDFFFTGRKSPRFYLSTGSLHYQNASETLPSSTPTKTASATAVDVDADGDLDLFVGGYKEPNVLLINDGTGKFTDGTEAAGFVRNNYRTVGSSWADFDGDGDLDVYIANYGAPQTYADPSLLYENDGAGTFEISDWALPPDAVDGHSFIGGWHDLNDDLRPELYVVNDFSWNHPNPVLWNQGDSFLQDDGTAGLAIKANCMGLGVGDINSDGIPDVMVPAWNRLDLLVSLNGAPLFLSSAGSLGVNTNMNTQRQLGWASEMHDFDNDRDLDIYVVFGYLNADPPNPKRQPDALFAQQDDGTFEERAYALGLADEGMSRGMAVVDLNNDGWLDIIKPNKDTPANIALANCGSANWIRVKLEQPGPNPSAVGARIRLLHNDEALYRWLSLGSTGLASSSPVEAHFGLGDRDEVQRLEVRWPDGEFSQYENIAANQILTIRREP